MNRKAQNTIELTLLLCLVAAALVGMQVYLKRGIQGRIRAQAEQVGGSYTYSPGATNSVITVQNQVNESVNSFSNKTSATTKEYVYDSQSTVSQQTGRQENILPLAEEPKRQ